MANQSPPRQRPFQIVKLIGDRLPRDTEFPPNATVEVFAASGLPLGLCLGSKSAYRATHRIHYFLPNANVFGRTGKLWWGDLDLWRHSRNLERVAHRLGERLYVLREFDGRFDQASRPMREVARRAVWQTGGRTRVARNLLIASGLRVSDLSALIGVSPRRLNQPQLPHAALEINRRIETWQKVISPLAGRAGYRTWGAWLSASNSNLRDRSPIEVLRAGETLNLADVAGDALRDINFVRDNESALISAILLQCPPRISFRWPPTRCAQIGAKK